MKQCGGGGCWNTTTVFPADGKWRSGSGKLLLCILSYEKTGHRREEESNDFMNPKCLVLATTFSLGYKPGI